jgi:outer membrane receptor protein involved in Fe transport
MSASVQARLKAWLLLAFLSIGGPDRAIGDDEESDPDLHELSPFIVEADEDIGYLPTSTLSGTRLRTDFRDVGASIDAMTQEFLDDVGVVTVEESFIYSAHVESVEESVNIRAGSSDLLPGAGTRAMGLTAPTLSRNFFRALMPIDRYNTERIVIARGPQAILFGYGNPSGVVNTNLTRAGFDDDFLEFKTRFDNWGSRRLELDLNQELIADKLAMRLALVDDHRRFWLDPCSDKVDRKYGTFSFKPADWINIRVHHEAFDREGHVPNSQLPIDYVSYFLEPNEGELIDGALPFWAGLDWWNSVRMVLNSEGEAGPQFMSLLGAPVALPVSDVIKKVSDPSNKNYDPQNPFHDPDWVALDGTRSLSDDAHYPVFSKYFAGDLNTTRQDGESTYAFAEINVFREAGLFSDCYVELAYHGAEFYQLEGATFSGAEYGIKVDPNRYLADGQLNPNAGKLYVESRNNPILGDLRKSKTIRLTSSLKLDLNECSPLLGRHQFGFLLSNQEPEVNQQRAFRNIGNIGGIVGGVKPEAFTGVSMSGPSRNWRHPDQGRRLTTVVYLDESDGVYYPRADMIPWGGPLDTWYVPTEEGTFGIYAFDPDGPGMWMATDSVQQKINSGSASWQSWFRIQDLAVLVTTFGLRKDEFDAREKVPPGSFTNSFGETLTIRAGDDPKIEETGFYPHWDLMEWENEWSELGDFDNEVKAAVLQLDPFMDRVFSGKFRAALNYSESTNNTGYSSKRNVQGEFHEGQRGSGVNYGVRLEFLNSKYRLSVNKWKVDLFGATANSMVDFVRYDLNIFEARWRQIEPADEPRVASATGGYISDPNGVFSIDGPNRYKVCADQQAEGWTLDFVANPLPGLRIRANLSRTEAVQSNVGTDWVDWIRNVRSPLWASEIQWWEYSMDHDEYRPVIAWDPELSIDLNGNEIPDTAEDEDGNPYITLGDPDNPADIANILSGWDNIAMRWKPRDFSITETILEAYLTRIEGGHLIHSDGLEKLSNTDIREWRFNFTSTYTFQDGLFKNLSIGGTVRYRDKPFIGSRARFVELELPDGSTHTVATNDTSNLLFGDDFWFLDAMFGYRGKIKINRKSMGYAFQINIRNILDENGAYTTSSTTAGRPARVSQNRPREIYLSASLEF